MLPPLFKVTELNNIPTPNKEEKISKKKGWAIKLNQSLCNLVEKIDYVQTIRFIVSCKNDSELEVKEIIFSADVLVNESSIDFLAELEKEDKGDYLLYSKSHHKPQNLLKPKTNVLAKDCIFEGSYDEHSSCLFDWKSLKNL